MFSLVFVFCAQPNFADNTSTANIVIRMSGVPADNRYFLCIPNVGCLSILVAREGKIYPVFHRFSLKQIFITDTSQFYRVFAQNPPKSCQINVNRNQTVIISGNIIKHNGRVFIQNLYCRIH